MVVGNILRGVGRIAGAVHGTVFRALGRLPLVGGVFKGIGQLSAKAIGIAGGLAGMGLFGLGPMLGGQSLLGGFAEGSLQAQQGGFSAATQNIGGGFNQMYGQPNMGYGGMDMGYGGGGMGMPHCGNGYFQSPYMCGCNGY